MTAVFVLFPLSTRVHTLSVSHTHTLPPPHAHNLSTTLSYIHTFSLSLSLSLSHTHTHTHSVTHTRARAWIYHTQWHTPHPCTHTNSTGVSIHTRAITKLHAHTRKGHSDTYPTSERSFATELASSKDRPPTRVAHTILTYSGV